MKVLPLLIVYLIVALICLAAVYGVIAWLVWAAL
jgi:hypothetical protein